MTGEESSNGAAASAAQRLADRMAQIAQDARRTNLNRIDRLDGLINAGLDPQRRTEAIDIAHKLAGSAGTFGFMTVSDQARDLEEHLTQPSDERDGRDERVGGAELSKLRDWVVALRAGMQSEPDVID